MSCNNTFIDWCKPINEIELTTINGKGFHDVGRILDELNKMKNELCRVWIKKIIT